MACSAAEAAEQMQYHCSAMAHGTGTRAQHPVRKDTPGPVQRDALELACARATALQARPGRFPRPGARSAQQDPRSARDPATQGAEGPAAPQRVAFTARQPVVARSQRAQTVCSRHHGQATRHTLGSQPGYHAAGTTGPPGPSRASITPNIESSSLTVGTKRHLRRPPLRVPGPRGYRAHKG